MAHFGSLDDRLYAAMIAMAGCGARTVFESTTPVSGEYGSRCAKCSAVVANCRI